MGTKHEFEMKIILRSVMLLACSSGVPRRVWENSSIEFLQEKIMYLHIEMLPKSTRELRFSDQPRRYIHPRVFFFSFKAHQTKDIPFFQLFHYFFLT